jgi:hypothetical protein
MAFVTVGSIVTEVRTLLQDVDGIRWPDANVYQALNMGLLESRMIRPDFWRNTPDDVPQYSAADAGETLDFEPQFKPALVMYVAGLLQLEDDEGTEDARAAALLNTFTKKLTGPIGSA